MFPVLEAEEDTHQAGRQDEDAEYPGEHQRARDRLLDQHHAAGDVEQAQHDLPDEAAPSLGPERVDDLERTADNCGDADDEGADDGGEDHVAQHDDAHCNEDEPQQNAQPGRYFADDRH